MSDGYSGRDSPTNGHDELIELVNKTIIDAKQEPCKNEGSTMCESSKERLFYF